MTIAVLALQGAFLEHEQMLEQLGIPSIEIRQKKDLEQHFDGLILPGGESTVQGKLLKELSLFAPLQSRIKAGLPVLATCAGMILLAQQIENAQREQAYFQTLPVTVRRNAYGRQLGSFHTEAVFSELGRIPMTFIRAPYITKAEPGVSILATVNDNIVAVKYQNQIALSFHPELDESLQIHKMFLDLVTHTITSEH